MKRYIRFVVLRGATMRRSFFVILLLQAHIVEMPINFVVMSTPGEAMRYQLQKDVTEDGSGYV